jgi:hypothetical protein
MHALKIFSFVSLIASNIICAAEHYTVDLKLGESYTITLNSKQLADDRSNPGNKSIIPHLWRLDGYEEQTIVHLSDEVTGEKNTRVYDLKTGKWKVATSDVLAAVLLLPIGLMLYTPYEQEYLFTAATVGTARLTFLCERRYCWEAPTKVVTVDFNVTDQVKSKTKKLYIN